ncbi:hypothetical protein [Sediminibacillus massiliensis]|uniref:hypothetical protein n=1 Tax=Sediminibacillus massiliensis TaxID=1926277 RepID=UPI0009888F90|nr:hypothetical protein [Sediminibacillus massiliensis]
MTEKEKPNVQDHPFNRFDQMMFGPGRQPNLEEQQKKESETESFDLFTTAQTMMETYRQLSPYVKEISNMVKKFKK